MAHYFTNDNVKSDIEGYLKLEDYPIKRVRCLFLPYINYNVANREEKRKYEEACKDDPTLKDIPFVEPFRKLPGIQHDVKHFKEIFKPPRYLYDDIKEDLSRPGTVEKVEKSK